MAVCYADRVVAVGTNGYSRPRLLKVILKSELDLKLLLSRMEKLASVAPSVLFYRNYSLPDYLNFPALTEEIQHRPNQGGANLAIWDGTIISRPIIQKKILWWAPVGSSTL